MAKRGHRGKRGEGWDEGEGFGEDGGSKEKHDEEKAAAKRNEPKPPWRPFEGAQALESLKGKLGDMKQAPPPAEEKKAEQTAPEAEKPEEGEGQAEAAVAKAEAAPEAPPGKPPKEKKPRQPRKKKEAVKKEAVQETKEERIEAIYQDLKKSGKTYGDVLSYMEEHRAAYPKLARFEAAEKLLEDIKNKKITPEVIEKLKTRKFDEGVALGHEGRLKGPRMRRGKEPTKGTFYKGAVGRLGPLELDRLLAEPPKPEEQGQVYRQASAWSWDQWYNFLLGQYAARPEFAEKKIEDYLKKHEEERKKYSRESYEAHERLFDELLAEKEGRELGEKFRAREERAEGKEKPKLSEKDLDEFVLGFKEYLQNIPKSEGQPIIQRLREVQRGEFESMLGENISWDDINKRAAEIAAKEKIKPEEASVRAENELITEAARKFFALRELIVHHKAGWDPKMGFRMGYYSDFDGQGAVALYDKAIGVGKGAYVPPGYRRIGAMNLDTNLADGLFSEEEEKVDPETGEKRLVLTMHEDHHGIYSGRDSSATKYEFEDFMHWGLLKFESEQERRAWEKAVEFTTQVDNYTFPGVKGSEHYKTSGGRFIPGREIYETSDRRLIGYAYNNRVPFDKILQFFIDQEKEPENLQKTPADELSDGELARYGVYKKRTAKRGEKIKETLKTLEELTKNGWVVTLKNGKRLVVDVGEKMAGEGQWASSSRGFDGILRYNPENQGFSLALNKGTFDEETQELLKSLPQGILIRGSFFYKPPAEKAKIGNEEEMSDRTREMVKRVKGDLLVTLGDLVESIADPEKKKDFGKDLKEFLDKEKKEGRLIKTNIFKIVEREIISETVVTGKDIKEIRANWWATMADGTPIIVEETPRDFVSGEEGLIRLKDKTKAILRGENIEKFGLEWSGDKKEEKEVEVWFGKWEKTKFPELTPEERRAEEEKRKAEELIGEEIDVLRKKMADDPELSQVPERVREEYLKREGEEIARRLGLTSSK